MKDQGIDSLRSAPVMFCHRTSLSMGHGGPLGTDTEKDTQENPRGGPPYFAFIQWIGLRENLQESPIVNGKIYGFRLNFSLKPIQSPMP